MTDDASRQKNGWLGKFLLAAANLATVGGVSFAALEYRGSLERSKDERVSAYIDRFESGEVGAAVRRVSHEIRDMADRADYAALAAYAKSSPEAANEARTQLARVLAYDSREGEGLADELDQVVGFFNSLEVCIEQNLCTGNVAHAFLDEYASSFWANFGPYILERRVGLPTYGEAFERFCVERTADAPSATKASD